MNYNWKLLGLALLSIGLIVFFVFDPAKDSFFPKCPFLMVTGFQCPGCGSQRAVHQLLNGNIPAAFRFNPLLVVALPYVLVLLILEVGNLKTRFAKLYRVLYHYRTLNVIFIGIVSFWILRNL